jgi:methylmalonyl-CoA mutase
VTFTLQHIEFHILMNSKGSRLMKEQIKRTEKTAEVERLLGEFGGSTYDDWRAEAEKSLKGAPFEKKLLTETYEGITLHPIYYETDARDLPHLGGLPGFGPYTRGIEPIRDSSKPWEVCQEIIYPTPGEVNDALVRDLERGQSAIKLIVDTAGRRCQDPDTAQKGTVGLGGVSIIDANDFGNALRSVDPVKYPLYLQVGSAGTAVAAMLFSHARSCGADCSKIRGCIENDPLGALALDGSLPRPLAVLYDEVSALTRWALKHAPAMRTIAVSAIPYHEAGGSAVEELAFALATGVEYVREILARGLDVDEIASSILFKFSVGSNFFMEVAKLRAARLVWATAMEALGCRDEARKMFMHVRTSAYCASALDPFTNMLRGTTETFSAVVAGADGIHTSPFDEPVRPPEEFSRRIARNVQVILRDESHLGHVVDPAGGSWYVERLTGEIASKAWALFQDIERQGGMAKALGTGATQKIVSRTADARANDLAARKSTIIGTNIYPNLKEKPLDQKQTDFKGKAEQRIAYAVKVKADAARNERAVRSVEKLSRLVGANSAELFDAAVHAASDGATLGEICRALSSNEKETFKIEPLRIHRASQRHERLREFTAAHAARTGKRPRVFLANLGPIPQHKARADFSTGFFEVGGLEVLGNEGFKTPEEAAIAAARSGAEIVVICSTDETYPEVVPGFTKSFKGEGSKAKIILAGYPKDQIDAHKAAGVDEFIHLKANNYEVLIKLLKEIGVTL